MCSGTRKKKRGEAILDDVASRGELCGGDSASGTESRGNFRKFGNRREISKVHQQLHLVLVYTFELSVIVG